MANAYVIDESSIKLPKELFDKLKLKKGMEFKVLSIEDGSILLVNPNEPSKKDFQNIKGIGKEIWNKVEAQRVCK